MRKLALALLLVAGLFGGTQAVSAAPTTTVYPVFTYPFKSSRPQDCPVFAVVLDDLSALSPGSVVTEKLYVSAPGACTLAFVVFTP